MFVVAPGRGRDAGALIALVPKAKQLGLIDRPTERKRHDRATPMVGGLAVSVSRPRSASRPTSTMFPFMLASALFVVVGVVDDRIEINDPQIDDPHPIIIGFLFTTSVQTRPGAGRRDSRPRTGDLGYFTVVALIGLINAFNLIDGLDGLAWASR